MSGGRGFHEEADPVKHESLVQRNFNLLADQREAPQRPSVFSF